MNTGRKWHHLDRYLWPIRHVNELFNLALTQTLITDQSLNYAFVQDEE